MVVSIPILHRDKTDSGTIGTEETQVLLFNKKSIIYLSAHRGKDATIAFQINLNLKLAL